MFHKLNKLFTISTKCRKCKFLVYRADHETRIRTQKTTKLKQVDNRIITLKREISKLKDILAEYGTYQGFLSDLSPQSWRDKQKTSDDKVQQPLKISV